MWWEFIIARELFGMEKGMNEERGGEFWKHDEGREEYCFGKGM